MLGQSLAFYSVSNDFCLIVSVRLRAAWTVGGISVRIWFMFRRHIILEILDKDDIACYLFYIPEMCCGFAAVVNHRIVGWLSW